MTLNEKIEEIKAKHRITEEEIVARLPFPLGFKKGHPTEEELVNFLDLLYG